VPAPDKQPFNPTPPTLIMDRQEHIHIITASGFAPVEFACHIFRKLGVMHPATLDAWHGLFTTRRPEYFYALMASLPGQQKGE
jgi:hypothetical protein